MMKIYTALSLLVVGLHAGFAQDAKDIKIKSDNLQISTIQTPQFSAGNVGEKRWRPKDWMEVDLPFEVTLSNEAGGRKGSLSMMTVTYYIGLNAQTKEGKFEVIKAVINYADIPASEKSHALSYVAPATIRRILGKDSFTSSDIKAWGYEITVGGTLVGGATSTGSSKWWEKADAFSMNDGALLAKTDTPFGILWGDYDVQAKKN
jgi:hypothetical protein